MCNEMKSSTHHISLAELVHRHTAMDQIGLTVPTELYWGAVGWTHHWTLTQKVGAEGGVEEQRHIPGRDHYGHCTFLAAKYPGSRLSLCLAYKKVNIPGRILAAWPDSAITGELVNNTIGL